MGMTLEPAERGALMDRSTSIDQVVDKIEKVKVRPQGQALLLTPLLSVRHPVYRDRTTGETVRIRGYAMAALELTGTPEHALPYILEVLESEFHPYLVAAAARSLRGLASPHPQIAPFLLKAIHNVRDNDNPVSFNSYRVEWPQKEYSTALTELFETLASFGSYAKTVLPELTHLYQYHADQFAVATRKELAEAIGAIQGDEREVDLGCCKIESILQRAEEVGESAKPRDVPGNLLLQDQDGVAMEWDEFFTGKPTIVAFFYTRCQNPRKCTQTIFNIAAVQREMAEAGLGGRARIAAMTYDPQFDTPEALKCFGNARKFMFDADSRMLRVPEGFDRVVRAFGLGVNFTGSQVNSHRIELYLLNEEGALADSFLRIQSEPTRVVEAMRSLLSVAPVERRSADSIDPNSGGEKKVGDRFQAGSSVILGLLMAFFPKCPMCWYSYLSVLGLASAETIPYSPWMLPAIVFTLSLNLFFLFRAAPTRNGYTPFVLSLFGSVLLLLSNPLIDMRWTLVPGLGLLLSGSVLQSLSYARFSRLMLFLLEFRHTLLEKMHVKFVFR